jgi:hypothetical protein
MASTVLVTGSTLTVLGLKSMLSASFSISGGMVALKKSVCRFGEASAAPAHIVDEAHVQHAVGLVQHEDLQVVQADVALAMRSLSRRPGVATRMSTPAAQRIGLWVSGPRRRRSRWCAVGMLRP